jgi:hypothetical protein
MTGAIRLTTREPDKADQVRPRERAQDDHLLVATDRQACRAINHAGPSIGVDTSSSLSVAPDKLTPDLGLLLGAGVQSCWHCRIWRR